jgi:hypothetical protein
MSKRLRVLAGRALSFLAIAIAVLIAPFGCDDAPKNVTPPAGDFPAIKKANKNMENFAKEKQASKKK